MLLLNAEAKRSVLSDRLPPAETVFKKHPVLSIVIPAYNEETRLPRTLGLLKRMHRPYAIEIIVVCDGCTDKTHQVAQQWTERLPLRVIAYPENRGKGYAVQRGVLSASGQVIAFMDADGSTPPSELLRLAAPIISGDADIVVGSRRADGAMVKRQPLGRHLLGKLFSVITRNILSLPYRDTQCGLKLFRRQWGMELFGEMRCEGFEFDLEILYRARKKKIPIVEMGVAWEDRAGSKVAPVRDGLKMLRAMFRIKGAYRSSRPARSLAINTLAEAK